MSSLAVHPAAAVLHRSGRTPTPLILAFLLTAASCEDPAGPGGADAADTGGPPPGRLLLNASTHEQWQWVGDHELLYGTQSQGGEDGARLEAIDVSSGALRTIAVVPPEEGSILPFAFEVRGARVYFRVASSSPNDAVIALYRVALAGGGAPERVLDSIASGVSVSPDESMAARVDAEAWPKTVAVIELATGETKEFTLPSAAHGVWWAPGGGSILVGNLSWTWDGNILSWIDLSSGSMDPWIAHPDNLDGEQWDIAWHADEPYVYTTGPAVMRHSITTDAAVRISGAGGRAASWAPDFSSVVLVNATCTGYGSEPSSSCTRYENEVQRVDLQTGNATRLLRFHGSDPVGGRAATRGTHLAYEIPGDGVYVVEME